VLTESLTALKLGLQREHEAFNSELYLLFLHRCGFMARLKRSVRWSENSLEVSPAAHEAMSSGIVEDVLVCEAVHSFHFLRLRVPTVRARSTTHTHTHTHTLTHVVDPAVTNVDQIVYDDDVKDQACWSPWLTSFVE